MTKIYLVRHTQTKGNLEKRLTGRSDYELTKDGELFVEKMNRRLSEVKFDIAYCSTSRRTKKTKRYDCKQWKLTFWRNWK